MFFYQYASARELSPRTGGQTMIFLSGYTTISVPVLSFQPVNYQTGNSGFRSGHSQPCRQPLTIVSFNIIDNAYDIILSRQPLCIAPGLSIAQVGKLVSTPRTLSSKIL